MEEYEDRWAHNDILWQSKLIGENLHKGLDPFANIQEGEYKSGESFLERLPCSGDLLFQNDISSESDSDSGDICKKLPSIDSSDLELTKPLSFVKFPPSRPAAQNSPTSSSVPRSSVPSSSLPSSYQNNENTIYQSLKLPTTSSFSSKPEDDNTENQQRLVNVDEAVKKLRYQRRRTSCTAALGLVMLVALAIMVFTLCIVGLLKRVPEACQHSSGRPQQNAVSWLRELKHKAVELCDKEINKTGLYFVYTKLPSDYRDTHVIRSSSYLPNGGTLTMLKGCNDSTVTAILPLKHGDKFCTPSPNSTYIYFIAHDSSTKLNG